MTPARARRFKTYGIIAGAVALAGAALALGIGRAPLSAGKAPAGPSGAKTAAAPVAKKVSAAQALVKVESAQCTGQSSGLAPSEPVLRGNPRARSAAQRGLDFLAANTVAWQKQHNCYGCHVQAVTLEGMVVGRENQYEVSSDAMSTVLDGLLTLPGGARTPGGLQYTGGSLLTPSKAFGGAALARYDAAIDGRVSDDVHAIAEELVREQREDGSYNFSYPNRPVATTDVQGTYLAIRTWKQAYERSADDRWLTAVQKAERYLHGQASAQLTSSGQDVQELDYLLMGLIESGVGAAEDLPSSLRVKILAQQNQDGGWPLNGGGLSSPFATGQALYALRMAGLTDGDEPIRRGTDWLIENQRADGGWSDAGSARAEAMWAVLGLVSLDLMTVAVNGVTDGQLAEHQQMIAGHASDNEGGAVHKMELTIDDILVASQCGADLTYKWDTTNIEDGKHVVVMTASNAKGETSKRRMELYTGDVYITQIGSKFTDSGTEVSLRNIAPDKMDNRVRMRIFSRTEEGAAGGELSSIEQIGAQGSMRFVWDGKDGAGKALDSGKYLARLEVMDEHGKVMQTEEMTIVNASREVQQQQFAEISGRLAFDDGDVAENAELELVDAKGRVVERARSTKKGQYRFRNVDKGEYKIRVKKKGFVAAEKGVVAAPAAEPAKVEDMVLNAE